MTIFSVLQAMIMTLHASLIENSSNHQINSQTKVNLRLKNGRLIHARFLIGVFFPKAKHNRFHAGPPAWIERKFTFLLRLFKLKMSEYTLKIGICRN
jgi:hypothetical protein